MEDNVVYEIRKNEQFTEQRTNERRKKERRSQGKKSPDWAEVRKSRDELDNWTLISKDMTIIDFSCGFASELGYTDKQLRWKVLIVDPDSGLKRKINFFDFLPYGKDDKIAEILKHMSEKRFIVENVQLKHRDGRVISYDIKGKSLSGGFLSLRFSLAENAVFDELTGLPNFRALQKFGKRHLEIAKRKGLRVFFLLVDVDYFDITNKLYGYDGANLILKKVAEGLRKFFRLEDFIARYGGDEFVVLAIIGEGEELKIGSSACRLEHVISHYDISCDGFPLQMAISTGYAISNPGESETCSLDDLFIKANATLLETKKPKYLQKRKLEVLWEESQSRRALATDADALQKRSDLLLIELSKDWPRHPLESLLP